MRTPHHRERVMVRCRSERQGRGVEEASLIEQVVAFVEIETFFPDVTSTRRCLGGLDRAVRSTHGVFLDENCVCTLRQGCAREDANRLSGEDRSGERSSGRGLADDRQDCREQGDIVRPHGVAVHRRCVEGRLRSKGCNRLRQHPPGCFVEGQVFRGPRFEPVKKAFQRLGNGQKAHDDGSARKSPDFPPVFSRSRMSEMTIVRSAAFAMS